MRFVYFESLKPDGTVEPQLIASDEIGTVSPLSAEEQDFADKLRDGYFGETPFASKSAYERMRWERDNELGREFVVARLAGYDVPHHSAKSILRMKNGEKCALRESVSELAASQSGLLVLNGDPRAADEKAGPIVLGRPQLEQGKRLLIEFKHP